MATEKFHLYRESVSKMQKHRKSWMFGRLPPRCSVSAWQPRSGRCQPSSKAAVKTGFRLDLRLICSSFCFQRVQAGLLLTDSFIIPVFSASAGSVTTSRKHEKKSDVHV